MRISDRTIPGDWFRGFIPENVIVGDAAYIHSTYHFAGFRSDRDRGLTLGKGAGLYGAARMIVGPLGVVWIGDHSSINGTLICAQSIEVGAHCMIAWGSMITDCWPDETVSVSSRREAVVRSARTSHRFPPLAVPPEPVVLEDSVWIGFGAVILPGVRVGRGSIVGCKTILRKDVPPYTIVAGDPARSVGSLRPSDTAEARRAALARAG